VAFFAGKMFLPCTRHRSENASVADELFSDLSGFPSGAAPTASAKDTLYFTAVSSTLRPAWTSVWSPRAMPARPPSARKASRDLGFRSLRSCPGLKAKGLSRTSKSASVPGSGRSASDDPYASAAAAAAAAGDTTVCMVDERLRIAGVEKGLDAAVLGRTVVASLWVRPL
jgi:hypothetical protein